MPWTPKTHKPTAAVSSAQKHRAYDRNRGSARERGYGPAWDKTRKDYALDNPLCEECLLRDIIVPVAVVDHITPLSEGGALHDSENLQSLCWSCHERKKARERRG